MSTPAIAPSRAEINRANAALSTGPVTEQGKAASARNSFKHGLSGFTFSLLPTEDREVFAQLVAELQTEYQPQTPVETHLVEKLAQQQWLAQRAVNFQAAAFNDDGSINDRRLSLALRYLNTHERLCRECLIELTRVQQERKALARKQVMSNQGLVATPDGFVSKAEYVARMKAKVEAEMDAEEAALNGLNPRR